MTEDNFFRPRFNKVLETNKQQTNNKLSSVPVALARFFSRLDSGCPDKTVPWQLNVHGRNEKVFNERNIFISQNYLHLWSTSLVIAFSKSAKTPAVM